MTTSSEPSPAASDANDESSPHDEQAKSVNRRHRRRAARKQDIHHTRISGAWAAVVVGVVLGVALIDFIVQNTRKVRIEFFGASGRIPVAVALLAAALVGAVVVLIIGMCRTTQLRLVLRRKRVPPSAEQAAPKDQLT